MAYENDRQAGIGICFRCKCADTSATLQDFRVGHSEPDRVCGRLQLLSKLEHDEQNDEQVFPLTSASERFA
ncbi:MAG: hypothetical protein CL534_09115 [Ahrensia sp.]|nr:hypothetical protein [Ahrensia sp.]